jgi:hypothetical protein
LRTGGSILAQQTDIALNHTSGDWAFYLQADEVVHERDLPVIRQAMLQHLDDPTVEGLLFNFIHFYGSYRYVGNSRKWYRREIRVVRNKIGVQSWRDAQGFRIGPRKMNVKLVDASVYHYGWVKSPSTQQRKQMSFNRLWHSDEWISDHVGSDLEFDYSDREKLILFDMTHPEVMKSKVQAEDWKFQYDETQVNISLKERVLDTIERVFGHRIGEYRNYRII